jgi:hypothetical protein
MMEKRVWKIPIGGLQGELEVPFGAFSWLVPKKQEILSFVRKFPMKRKGG